MAVNLKNKNVLVFGLGMLGGGIATTEWLLDHGANVTVTDLKDAKTLASSTRSIEGHLRTTAKDGTEYHERKQRLTWALGGHSNELIDAADLVVVNPDVSINNPFIRHAREMKIPVVNEGVLFYEYWKKKTIGVTGTRGKTTTATWTAHLVPQSIVAGNSTTKPFMAMLDQSRRANVAVTELPSFILELFYQTRSPHVAVVTNLYRDHLNRHGTMEEYARAKAAIFVNQTTSDWLVLNNDNEWTGWFLEQEPAGRVRYTSMRPLPLDLQGVWYSDQSVYEREKGKEKKVLELDDFSERWGEHNIANLLAAAYSAHLVGVPWARIQGKIGSLPQVPYRQEVVYRDRKLTVVNDTTATTPEGGIAALRRWGGPNCILITGGTDRELDYRSWADELPKYITSNNTILIAGSATDKMRAALGPERSAGIRTYDSLERCWRAAYERARKYISAVVLFSPAAKSFELFDNEFDRGQQFNTLIKGELE